MEKIRATLREHPRNLALSRYVTGSHSCNVASIFFIGSVVVQSSAGCNYVALIFLIVSILAACMHVLATLRGCPRNVVPSRYITLLHPRSSY